MHNRRLEIRPGVNLVLAAVLGSVNLAMFLVLPLLLSWDMALAWLLLPVILLTPTFWSVIHEAIHGTLHPDRRMNARIGRLLCICFGAPFRVLRFGHLMHHRLSRTSFDAVDVYEPDRTRWATAALIYYPRILFGLYAAEICGNVLTILPQRVLRPIACAIFHADPADATDTAPLVEKALLADHRLAEVRCDAAGVLVLFGTAFWLYGEHWVLLAAALAGRGLLVSLLDNMPHYATALGRGDYAYNLKLPRILAALILNFNLHRVHHNHPNLPWSSLPQAFERDAGGYDLSYGRGVVQQLKGPVAAGDLRPVPELLARRRAAN